LQFIFGWICHSGTQAHSLGRRVGIQVLAGLAPSSKTKKILLRTPAWQEHLTKSEFSELNSMEKFTQQLFMKSIQECDKPFTTKNSY